MACSVYGSQYLLDGLYEAGEADYAFELLTSTGERSWWNMIRVGSTISLEAWDMKYKPNSDWNHAWGAAPANIISRRLWGIRPVAPGFSKAIIEPQPGKLEYSQITVPTIKGAIKATFNRTDAEKEVYTIELPGEIYADFVIPMEKFRSVHVNKKRASAAKGSVALKPGRYEIEIRK
jgi:hypothetical protein